MSAQAPREQQRVRGVVTSVVAKQNDSFQIEVKEEGAQYTRKLWTKDTQLVNLIHQQGIGQNFDFMCNASHWTNQSGQSVRSLWIEEIAQYGSLQAPQPVAPTGGLPGMGAPQGGLPLQPQQGFVGGPPAPGQVGPGYLPGVSVTPPIIPQAQPQQLPPPQADPQWQSVPPVIKEERILRQTAMKCACIMQGYLPEDQRGIHGLEQMAEWFVNYFKGGPQLQAQPSGPMTPPLDGDGPPDWVTSQGPVPPNYNAGGAAQPMGQGSEDGGLLPAQPVAQGPGAYTGGFPS